MQETVGSALSPGAGRMIDFLWPDPGNATATMRTRLMAASNATGQTQANGAAISEIHDAIYEMDYVTLTTAATAGSEAAVAFSGGVSVLHFNTKSNLGVPAPCNDMLVTRLYANMFIPQGASGPLNDGLHDFGFFLLKNGANLPLSSNGQGFGFQIADAHTVQFISRDNTGVVTTPLTAAPFDCTVPHCYEMRITAATNSTDARLQALIDGAPVALPVSQSSWAAATRRLPPNVTGGGGATLGWIPTLVNFAGQIATLGIHQVRIIVAPSVLGTL